MKGKLVRTIAAIVAGSIVSLTAGAVATATTGGGAPTVSTNASTHTAEAAQIKKLGNQLRTAADKKDVAEVKRIIDQIQAKLNKLRDNPTLNAAARDAIANVDARAGELQRTLTDNPDQEFWRDLVYAMLDLIWRVLDYLLGTAPNEPWALDSDSPVTEELEGWDDDVTSSDDQEPEQSDANSESEGMPAEG